MHQTLKRAGLPKNRPMWATLAKTTVKYFKGAKKDEKYRFTAAVPVEGADKLAGAGLLQKSLRTDEDILGYVKNVVEAKSNEWGERDFRKTQYIWRMPGAPIFIKQPTDKLLIYDTYERFVR